MERQINDFQELYEYVQTHNLKKSLLRGINGKMKRKGIGNIKRRFYIKIYKKKVYEQYAVF